MTPPVCYNAITESLRYFFAKTITQKRPIAFPRVGIIASNFSHALMQMILPAAHVAWILELRVAETAWIALHGFSPTCLGQRFLLPPKLAFASPSRFCAAMLFKLR